MPKKKIQEGTAEIDADVIVVKPEKQSDYAQFAAYARQLGCTFGGVVGRLPDNESVRVETWVIPDRAGESRNRFLLLVGKDGKVGVFDFVGRPFAPLVADIQWLHEKVLQTAERESPGQAP